LRTCLHNAEAVCGSGPDDVELDAIVGQNSGEAIGRGVFGTPNYVFGDGEIMWGQYHLDLVAEGLASEG
jgi:2-hydroxychromene-2-carboxylate isomerase